MTSLYDDEFNEVTKVMMSPVSASSSDSLKLRGTNRSMFVLEFIMSNVLSCQSRRRGAFLTETDCL